MNATISTLRESPGVWRLAWKVAQHRPRTFWFGWALFVLFFTFPVATGWPCL